MSFQLLQSTGSQTTAAFAADTAGLSIPDDIDIRVRVAMATWGVPPVADAQTFVSKRAGGNEWQFFLTQTDGRPAFGYWVGAASNFETANDDLPFVDGQTGWVRVRREGTSTTFYYSEDDTNDHTAVSWTQLGDVQTSLAGNIDDVATHVTIGAFGLGGGDAADAYFYAVAIVEDTTDRGNPVFADPAEWTVGEDSGDTAVDAAGVTWQLSTQGRIVGDNIQGAYLSVQASFGTNPVWGSDGTVADWTDLTSDMRAVSFQRGRQYELDRINAGTMTVTLSNASGNYNAHNTAGAYYPNVKPMVSIRLRAVYGGQIYPLWQGFVERWPVSFPAKVDSVVDVQCVDLFKLLSLADAALDNRTATVEALNPVAWWRFADETDEAGGDNDLTFSGSPTEGGAAGAWEGDVATTFDGANDFATVANDDDVTREGEAMSWEVWCRPTQDDDVETLFSIGAFGIQWAATNGFFAGGAGFGAATVDDWHHAVYTHDGNGNVALYVDGVLTGSGFIGAATRPVDSATVRIGRDQSGTATAFFTGDISEIAVYPTVLTAQEVAGLYAASYEAYATERTDERIAYILSDSAIGLGSRFVFTDLEEGQVVMSGPNSPTEGSALETIQVAADTEFGSFFMTGNGTARFHDRHYRPINQNVAIDTFGPSNLPYTDVVLGMDDERIYNDIRVATSDGADPFIVQDADSMDAYGRRTLDKTTYPDDEMQGYDLAHYLKQLYAEPDIRIELLSFRLGGDSDLWPIILNGELGDRYNVQVPLVGDDLDEDVFLEQISHSITAGKTWDVTWQLSPASVGSFWLLGVAGFSELGETTILGY